MDNALSIYLFAAYILSALSLNLDYSKIFQKIFVGNHSQLAIDIVTLK